MDDQERAAAFVGATEMAPGHDAGDLAFALAEQFAAIRQDERAAIVAWLRQQALRNQWGPFGEYDVVVTESLADRIERGEHQENPS